MSTALSARFNELYCALNDGEALNQLACSVSCFSELSLAILHAFLHCSLIDDLDLKFDAYAKLEERLNYFHCKFPRLPTVFIPTVLEFSGECCLAPLFMAGTLYEPAKRNEHRLSSSSLLEQLRTEFTLDRNTTVWRTFQTRRDNGKSSSSTVESSATAADFFSQLSAGTNPSPAVISTDAASANRSLCMRMLRLSMTYFRPDSTPTGENWRPENPTAVLVTNKTTGENSAGNSAVSGASAETPSSPPPEEQGMDIGSGSGPAASPEGPASPPPEDQGIDIDGSKRSRTSVSPEAGQQSKRFKLSSSALLPTIPILDNSFSNTSFITHAEGEMALVLPSSLAPNHPVLLYPMSPLKQLLASRMQSAPRYLAIHLLKQLGMELDELFPIYGEMSDVTCHFRTLFFGENHARIVKTIDSNTIYWHIMALIAETTGLQCSHLLIPILRHLLISYALYWDTTHDAPSSEKYKFKLHASILLSQIIEHACPEKPIPIHMVVEAVEPRAKAVVFKLLWRLVQTLPTPLVAIVGIHSPPLPNSDSGVKKQLTLANNKVQQVYRLQLAAGLTPAAHEEFCRVLAAVAHQLRALLLKRGIADERFKPYAHAIYSSKSGLYSSAV